MSIKRTVLIWLLVLKCLLACGVIVLCIETNPAQLISIGCCGIPCSNVFRYHPFKHNLSNYPIKLSTIGCSPIPHILMWDIVLQPLLNASFNEACFTLTKSLYCIVDTYVLRRLLNDFFSLFSYCNLFKKLIVLTECLSLNFRIN